MRHSVEVQLRRFLGGLLLLPVGAGSAAAQRTMGTIAGDFSNGVTDILYVWSSPVRADWRDWAAAGLAGAIVVAAGVADRDLNRWIVANPSSAAIRGLEPFREGQDLPVVDLGSPKRLLPASGALYLVGFIANSRAVRDAALGCASAQQAQAGIQSLALQIVQRNRPLTAEGDAYDVGWGSGPWERHSFFSGHMSTVMSCVSYWNERFHMGRVEPVLYVIAAGVGLGRMADQRHWASDVVAGTIFGYAVGTTVGRRARKRGEREDSAPIRAGVLDGAYLTGGPGGMMVGWQVAF
jgi:membrane-associated phospholipid phosphatase